MDTNSWWNLVSGITSPLANVWTTSNPALPAASKNRASSSWLRCLCPITMLGLESRPTCSRAFRKGSIKDLSQMTSLAMIRSGEAGSASIPCGKVSQSRTLNSQDPPNRVMASVFLAIFRSVRSRIISRSVAITWAPANAAAIEVIPLPHPKSMTTGFGLFGTHSWSLYSNALDNTTPASQTRRPVSSFAVGWSTSICNGSSRILKSPLKSNSVCKSRVPFRIHAGAAPVAG
mmetsp:Transcript_19915/g.48450  ORF Transcript_19915/g.48450 Transcript_19915/m.48450 type:complete len:232 (-) Transcript_19915:564-1259(-)